MVDDAKVWFFDLVERSAASSSRIRFPGLTEGRIYSGRQAVKLKLVDQIGDERAAPAWLSKERKFAPGLKVVEWKPKAEIRWLIRLVIRARWPRYWVVRPVK